MVNCWRAGVHLFVLLLVVQPGQSQQVEKYCRFWYQGNIYYGKVVHNDILVLDNPPWHDGQPTGQKVVLNQVKLLFPCEPHVIIGLSKSYRNAWKNRPPPKTVRWFIKPPSSAASPGDAIILPPTLDEVKGEAELVIVIGKPVKNASEEEAESAIFGYTLGNDIVGTVVSYHRRTGEDPDYPEKILATGLKIGDRFAPFGPFIYRGINWRDLSCKLVVQHPQTQQVDSVVHNTNGLLYTPAKIVSDLSRVLTLQPGDVIFTGTQQGLLAHNGDVVRVAIQGLGEIENIIVVPGAGNY